MHQALLLFQNVPMQTHVFTPTSNKVVKDQGSESDLDKELADPDITDTTINENVKTKKS
jgi:hypothetical protein